jgi:hypothetical protein
LRRRRRRRDLGGTAPLEPFDVPISGADRVCGPSNDKDTQHCRGDEGGSATPSGEHDQPEPEEGRTRRSEQEGDRFFRWRPRLLPEALAPWTRALFVPSGAKVLRGCGETGRRSREQGIVHHVHEAGGERKDEADEQDDHRQPAAPCSPPDTRDSLNDRDKPPFMRSLSRVPGPVYSRLVLPGGVDVGGEG